MDEMNNVIRITDIVWDTDGEDVDLPTETEFYNVPQHIIDEVKEDGYCEEITDKLSAIGEYLVVSYNVEVI